MLFSILESATKIANSVQILFSILKIIIFAAVNSIYIEVEPPSPIISTLSVPMDQPSDDPLSGFCGNMLYVTLLS